MRRRMLAWGKSFTRTPVDDMRKPTLSAEEAAELEQLRTRYLTIIDFFGTHGSLPAAVALLRQMVEQVYTERDLRELRGLRRDFSEMIRSMNSENQRTLGAILQSLDGTDMVEDRRRDCKALEAIQGLRRINNDEEFQLVMTFLSDVNGECDPAVDRVALSGLMLEYQETLRISN
jgi:uncharacterized protein YnzC (UPF0291/DUF896 family)